MSRPVQMSSGPYFRDTLRDYSMVFAMFYKCSDVNTRAMLAIFESLCEEHSTPSVAFVKVKKDDLPGLCVEHDIPRNTSVTFAAFKNERKVGMTDGTNSKELERMVESHVRSARPRLRGGDHGSCDCCDSRARTRSVSSRPERVVHAPRARDRPRSASRHRVPLVVDWPGRRHAPRNATIPADLTYVDRRGPRAVERRAHLEYLGGDGRYHRTDDVRLQRTPRGAEATYLDWSGPIAIERTIGR
ncbi:hypothetical protein PMZ80_006492 [Knufia obscura]|uniref:Thioredoxin domain-containing protein n=2 Tax=Knufia TaxID=430999 RepID=A0AAN8EE30_9EURO|nr:hypothetical protein PMZ80_006492 [Knufia obscura]KAK5953358.1 hypothetical protein OHC33_005302 [Knufia fluminis]